MFENDNFEKKAMDISQHRPTLSHDNKKRLRGFAP